MIVLKMADSEGGKVARLQFCIICGRKVPMAYFMDTIPETVEWLFARRLPGGATGCIFIINLLKIQ